MKSNLDQPVSNPDLRLENAPDTEHGKIFGGVKKTQIAQGNRSYNQFNDDPSIEDENKGSEVYPLNIAHLEAQTITFPDPADMAVGAPDQTLTGTSSSGLPITYTTSDATKATIVNGKLHAVAAGAVNVTASQAGDTQYAAATPVVNAVTITA